MQQFPTERMKPLSASLCGTPGDMLIDIPLVPFHLGEGLVKTNIRLEGINLPVSEVTTLAGRSFHFPVNPEDGYIDGSIYIEHAHHPIDVHEISFGESVDGETPIRLKVRFVFSTEGLHDFADFDCELATTIVAKNFT